ncbi:MAG: hypothetical protein ACI9WU_001629 [Myxococcota bacterium]|jgi:hypothetical protein
MKRFATKKLAPLSAFILVLGLAGLAQADRSPIRRGADDGTPRRGGLDGDRSSRRDMEGGPSAAEAEAQRQKQIEEQKQREQTKVINLLTPPRCGSANAPLFKRALLNLQSPNERFNVEVWGNKRTYYVLDNIFYFLRANKTAFVTMFWIGPEGSVFVPFANLPVAAGRNHKIDPRNIIVEPVGQERWRVIATPKPHVFPCRGSDAEFMSALGSIKQGTWASGRWDVMSKVPKRRRRLRSRHR